MNYVLITNVPSPYRAKQYNLIGDLLGKQFIVFYTHSNYPTTKMKWERPNLTHQHIFLSEVKYNFISRLLLLFKLLKNGNPKLVITSGFNLIMLMGFLYSKLCSKKHIIFTDSWLYPTNQLGYFHHLIRKIVIKRSNGFICVGKKGKEYLEYYGATSNKIFISRLSNDIEFKNSDKLHKEYHLVFSGQLIKRKQPLFFVDIVNEVAKSFIDLKVLIMGNGPLEKNMLHKLNEYKINYKFEGFVLPDTIKNYYCKAKILLFPTTNDPWGMVANDAMSVGLPVITTPFAGCADDLVVDGYNGFILDLDVNTWTEKTIKLLKDEKLYNELSKNAFSKIREFSVEKAASDFSEALIKIAE